jgi:hypothetical protein
LIGTSKNNFPGKEKTDTLGEATMFIKVAGHR